MVEDMHVYVHVCTTCIKILSSVELDSSTRVPSRGYLCDIYTQGTGYRCRQQVNEKRKRKKRKTKSTGHTCVLVFDWHTHETRKMGELNIANDREVEVVGEDNGNDVSDLFEAIDSGNEARDDNEKPQQQVAGDLGQSNNDFRQMPSSILATCSESFAFTC